MRVSSNAAITAGICTVLLGGCVQTEQLYAIRKVVPATQGKADAAASGATSYEPDDRPRVVPAGQTVKESFKSVANTVCSAGALKNAQPGFTASTWGAANKYSLRCTNNIATYAVDQCIAMTLAQNRFSGTTRIVTGAAFIAAALATDASALIAPNGTDKTAVAALATSVTANSTGVTGFAPPIVQPPVATIIAAGATYAEAVGITDADFIVQPPPPPPPAAAVPTTTTTIATVNPAATVTTTTTTTLPPSSGGPPQSDDLNPLPSDELVTRLARAHDAMLSQCTADAYGFGRIGHPRGIKVSR